MKIENIKFRGKSKRTGEWLYGDLEYNRKKDVARIHSYDDEGEYIGQQEVDKETIGQSTELYDENGSEIYEGDIVDWTFFYTRNCNGGAIECDTIVTGIIKWYQGGFILKVINNDFEDAGQYSVSSLNTDTKSDVVVKGNIYDNKELLTQEYERID